MKIKIVGLAMAVMILNACASLDLNECLNANWKDIGYDDAVRGSSTQRLSKHRKACAKHGITPDSSAYKLGHKEGVPLYCVSERGFQIASNGGSYPSICPKNQFVEFFQSYSRGRDVFSLKTKSQSLHSDIETLEQSIQSASEEIDQNEALIISSQTRTSERRALNMTNIRLRTDILEMQDSIYATEQELIDIQEQIEKISW